MTENREARWADWMRAANRGDAAAYDALLRDCAGALRKVARRQLFRMGFGEAETEDVVQEALLAIHLKRGTWDEARPILPWIHAIARYKLLDATRKLGRARGVTVATPVEDWADFLPEADPGPLREGGALDLARLVMALPLGQRNAVRALAIDGLSVTDAAARLEMSEGAVRVALHRGLARLREMAQVE